MTVKIRDENGVNWNQSDSLPGTDAWKKASVILAILLVVMMGYMIFEKQSKKLPDAIVRHDLANFVINIRCISSDSIVIRKNLENAYAFTTRKGKKQLDKILKGVNFTGRFAQGIFVDILIESILKEHETLYIISWIETEFQNSKVISKIRYEGFFRIQFLRVKQSKNSYLVNPSGIYIGNIVINKITDQKLGL